MDRRIKIEISDEELNTALFQRIREKHSQELDLNKKSMRYHRFCSRCGYDRKAAFINECPNCSCTWWRRKKKTNINHSED
jgi:hypothetical protein